MLEMWSKAITKKNWKQKNWKIFCFAQSKHTHTHTHLQIFEHQSNVPTILSWNCTPIKRNIGVSHFLDRYRATNLPYACLAARAIEVNFCWKFETKMHFVQIKRAQQTNKNERTEIYVCNWAVQQSEIDTNIPYFTPTHTHSAQRTAHTHTHTYVRRSKNVCLLLHGIWNAWIVVARCICRKKQRTVWLPACLPASPELPAYIRCMRCFTTLHYTCYCNFVCLLL